MYKIFQITAEKHVYDQVQGELYNRSWADLSLFGLRPGEIHCRRGICFRVIERVSSGVCMMEAGKFWATVPWACWHRGQPESRWSSARLWVLYTHAGHRVLRQSGNYPDARDVTQCLWCTAQWRPPPGIVRGEWFMRSEWFSRRSRQCP